MCSQGIPYLECQVWLPWQHPHLVQVLSVDHDSKSGHVIVTQFKQGASLRDLVYQEVREGRGGRRGWEERGEGGNSGEGEGRGLYYTFHNTRLTLHVIGQKSIVLLAQRPSPKRLGVDQSESLKLCMLKQ